MFQDFIYSIKIHSTLRKLSKQRVGLVLQPGDVWVIEKAISDDDETDVLLKTCYLRGWVEPIVDSIPKAQLEPNGSLPKGKIDFVHSPLWKLTDSGWAAINRSHQLVVLSLFLSVVVAFIALAT